MSSGDEFYHDDRADDGEFEEKVISLKRFTLDDHRGAVDYLLGTWSIRLENCDVLPDDLAGFRVTAAERCKSP